MEKALEILICVYLRSSAVSFSLCVGGLWLLVLTGCAAPPAVHTTFLRSVDLTDMTDKMARSFTSDDVIGQRTSSDAPWIISISKVANHTNQIIPDREKWLYIGRLGALLAQSDLAAERSIIWIIPPERWHIVAEELDISEEPYGLRMKPTHQLTAEFNVLTNTSARGRSDAYLCEFELIDLHTGTIVWEDNWEVKRAVSGRSYD